MPAWNGAKWIRREKRLAIYRRDSFSCVYCNSSDHLTLDHLVPRTHKSCTNRASNLVTACDQCNKSRGNKPWREFATRDAVALIKRLKRRSIKTHKAWAKKVLSEHESWTHALQENGK